VGQKWKSRNKRIRVTSHRKNQRKRRKDKTNGNAAGMRIAYSLFIVMFSGFLDEMGFSCKSNTRHRVNKELMKWIQGNGYSAGCGL
jgi:hypothetical protein